ncbi:MAG TPA: hypothetical protein VGQ29_01920 [Gemmatimonadales bacterium]|nr:hypothetical protein [Gemmatimonadales bacterium]
MPVYNDSLPWLIKQAPSFWANSVGGFTTGIEPLPSAADWDVLLQRLRRLSDRACALAWITSAEVCNRLGTALDQSAQAFAQGNKGPARTRLRSFIAELAAQHNAAGSLPVSHAAMRLLTTNAEYILAH